VESCLPTKHSNKIYSVLNFPSVTNSVKRRLFRFVCESDRNNFSSYKDFKKHRDPDTRIYAEIKRDIAVDIDKLKLNKKTLS